MNTNYTEVINHNQDSISAVINSIQDENLKKEISVMGKTLEILSDGDFENIELLLLMLAVTTDNPSLKKPSQMLEYLIKNIPDKERQDLYTKGFLYSMVNSARESIKKELPPEEDMS